MMSTTYRFCMPLLYVMIYMCHFTPTLMHTGANKAQNTFVCCEIFEDTLLQ